MPTFSECQLLGACAAQASAPASAVKLLEVLLILCAVAAWLSRLPYIVRKARVGRVLVTIPDRTGPLITVTAGAALVAAGLLLVSGKAGVAASTLRAYLGLSMILLGATLGLNFMFPTLIGSAGILDSYGRLSAWSNIESYTWSPDGDVLELRLSRSIFFQRRFVAVPQHLHKDVAAYLSHRLWGAQETPLLPEPEPDPYSAAPAPFL